MDRFENDTKSHQKTWKPGAQTLLSMRNQGVSGNKVQKEML